MVNQSETLQNFTSYSYYHILIACDSRTTADAVAGQTDISVFKRSSSESGKYDANKYRAKSAGGGSYVVVIDGSVDADLIIKTAKWVTIFDPSTTSMDGEGGANTIEVDGEMEIIEPFGIRFMDILSREVFDQLGSDPDGIMFVLKTIFVGNTDTGAVDVISNVRPLLLTAYDLIASFNQAGAEYTISFTGADNGSAKTMSVVAIAKWSNVAVRKGMTVTQAMASAEKQINKQYRTFVQEYAEETGNQTVENDHRLMRYEIITDPVYDSYIAGDNNVSQISNTQDDPILPGPPNAGIEELLNTIMMSSTQVVTDRGANEDPSSATYKQGYKILSSVQSTPDEYVVRYTIVPHKLLGTGVNSTGASGSVNVNPDDVMEFDYIHTGQNTRVLEFDMKMNMGMAFFQTLLTTNNYSDQTSQTGANGTQHSATSSAVITVSSGDTKRPKTPLHMGFKVESNLARNTKKPAASSSFRDRLNQFAFFENTEVKMKIAGAVELLDDILDGRGGVSSVPKLAKINIRIPATNDLEPGYEPFWYDGYYTIFAVDNVFDDGSFTQVLDLMSIPKTLTDIPDKELSDETLARVNAVVDGPSANQHTNRSAITTVLEQSTPRQLSGLNMIDRTGDVEWPV